MYCKGKIASLQVDVLQICIELDLSFVSRFTLAQAMYDLLDTSLYIDQIVASVVQATLG